MILIPQYFYLVFNQTWSRNRLLLRIASELILTVGCALVLFGNAGDVLVNYPDVPPSMARVFNFVLWGIIVVTVATAIGYWRKLSQMAQGT